MNKADTKTKGRQKSDRLVVPMKGSNAPGGKGATASKTVRQLERYREPADSPSGNAVSAEVGRLTPALHAVPLSRATDSPSVPAMTMPVRYRRRSKATSNSWGGNSGAGIRGKPRTPASRRAGCETHKSGSVRAGGGQPPPATRPSGELRKPASRGAENEQERPPQVHSQASVAAWAAD